MHDNSISNIANKNRFEICIIFKAYIIFMLSEFEETTQCFIPDFLYKGANQ